jgi:hypothetical protein
MKERAMRKFVYSKKKKGGGGASAKQTMRLRGEKNLVQHCCKSECLQPLTKRRIDPTRSNNNTTKTLSAGPAGGVYPPFCEGLQTTLVCSSAAPNFFPYEECV